MKFLCKYNGTYLTPSSADSVEAWDRLKSGYEYTVEVREARNPEFHRLAFALVNAMFDNQDQFNDFEAFRTELKILCGSYDHYIRKNGEVVYMPHSWSFASMDDIEFHAIYDKLTAIAQKRFGDAFVKEFE